MFQIIFFRKNSYLYTYLGMKKNNSVKIYEILFMDFGYGMKECSGLRDWMTYSKDKIRICFEMIQFFFYKSFLPFSRIFQLQQDPLSFEYVIQSRSPLRSFIPYPKSMNNISWIVTKLFCNHSMAMIGDRNYFRKLRDSLKEGKMRIHVGGCGKWQEIWKELHCVYC